MGAEERGKEERRGRWREVRKKYVRKNTVVVKIFFLRSVKLYEFKEPMCILKYN